MVCSVSLSHQIVARYLNACADRFSAGKILLTAIGLKTYRIFETQLPAVPDLSLILTWKDLSHTFDRTVESQQNTLFSNFGLFFKNR